MSTTSLVFATTASASRCRRRRVGAPSAPVARGSPIGTAPSPFGCGPTTARRSGSLPCVRDWGGTYGGRSRPPRAARPHAATQVVDRGDDAAGGRRRLRGVLDAVARLRRFVAAPADAAVGVGDGLAQRAGRRREDRARAHVV